MIDFCLPLKERDGTERDKININFFKIKKKSNMYNCYSSKIIPAKKQVVTYSQQPDREATTLETNYNTLDSASMKWSRGETLTREEFNRIRDTNIGDLAKFSMDSELSECLGKLDF
jgi:hypothetical protein